MSAVIDIPARPDAATARPRGAAGGAAEPAAGRPRGRAVEAAAGRRRLTVETTGADDVLVRALALLRRRGCRIVAVDFHAQDRHGPGRFGVTVEAPTRTGHRLESWLLGLVDVLEVRASQ